MDRSPKSSPMSSPLSLPESDLEEAEYFRGEIADPQLPPAKRQRIGDPSLQATALPNDPDIDALSSISTDTFGDVPQSPSAARVDEEDAHHEQVTVCAWDGCPAGDFGNMDRLVEHIHNDHIEGRQKKYTCEWQDCSRKSMPHASGYALKAHMRSHTREKPFYCALPECDRSFTRSDALAKHMRTVHETEALRPSDPIPKSMQPLAKSSTRLKLVIKQPQDYGNGDTASPGLKASISSHPDTYGPNATSDDDYLTPLSSELGFSAEELEQGPKELWRLLRRQLHWAEEEAESLKRECEVMEEVRKKEWLEKEILLDQVIKNELDWFERRKLVLATQPTVEDLKAQTLAHMDSAASGDSQGATTEKQEDSKGDQREAAAILANLHQG